jgi:hypothetical protein
MPKRRSTIPIAHADDLPTIAFTDEEWQAVEHAYAWQLDAEVSQQITTVTTQYLKDCVFERAAVPKEMARERIERIRRAAGDLESVMLNREAFSASSDELSRQQRQSAHSYADRLIRRHLDERRSRITNSALLEVVTVTDGDGNTTPGAREHHFRHVLKSLVVACDCALNDLSATENSDDEPWNWWIQRLTQIARRHGLPHGTRIVEARTERELSRRGVKSPSPFVTLVRALQEHVPARHTYSDEALAKAIQRAQGRTRDK